MLSRNARQSDNFEVIGQYNQVITIFGACQKIAHATCSCPTTATLQTALVDILVTKLTKGDESIEGPAPVLGYKGEAARG